MGRQVTGWAAVLVWAGTCGLSSAGANAADKTDEAATKPQPATEVRFDTAVDADEVARLVGQLQAEKHRDRLAATEKLRAMGPAVAPLLKAHLEGATPEARARLESLLAEMRWMIRGMLVRYVHKSAREAKPDIRVGDVILRVGDKGVRAPDDVLHRATEPLRFQILRDGVLREVRREPKSPWFLETRQWDFARDGLDIVEAFKAMERQDRPEALRHLRAAIARGDRSAQTLHLASLASEALLDHKAAWELYKQYRAALADDGKIVTWVSYAYQAGRLEKFALPCQTRWVLQKLLAEPGEPGRLGPALDYLLGAGQNYPLVREYARKHKLAYAPPHAPWMLKLAELEGRWNDVLSIWQRQGPAGDDKRAYLAAMALVHLGRVKEAAEMVDVLLGEKKEYRLWGHGLALLGVLVAADVAGESQLAEAFFQAMTKMHPSTFDHLVSNHGHRCRDLLPAARAMLPRLNAYFRKNPKADEVAYLLAFLHAHVPSEVEVDFPAVLKVAQKSYYKDGIPYHRAVHALRTGRLDAAAEALKRINASAHYRRGFQNAAAFLRDNADRLAADGLTRHEGADLHRRGPPARRAVARVRPQDGHLQADRRLLRPGAGGLPSVPGRPLHRGLRLCPRRAGPAAPIRRVTLGLRNFRREMDMKERVAASAVVAAAILVGALMVSLSQGSDDELLEAVRGVERETSSLGDSMDRLSPRYTIGDIEGGANKIVITYLNGETETMQGGSYYIVVLKDYVVIHMPKEGESINAASERQLVPFASVRSIRRVGEES